MKRRFEGGCLCGAVRYHCSDEPIRTYFCHCLDCQKESGAPLIAELSMHRTTIQVTGETTRFSRPGDSGLPVHRNFCKHCGSVVFTEYGADPDTIGIKSGTLDDPSWVKPAFHVYIRRKQPWLELADSLPRFEGDIPPH